MFASAYAYDDAGRAKWPASAINYTNKTQFLFRINKGIDNVWDNSAINAWQPKRDRPIPFSRMVFLGDGDTDVPSMKMVRQKGGQAQVPQLSHEHWYRNWEGVTRAWTGWIRAGVGQGWLTAWSADKVSQSPCGPSEHAIESVTFTGHTSYASTH